MNAVRRIKPDDIYIIEGWYEARATMPPEPFDFPEVGFMVDDTAAIFVYQTDASFALVEGLITNKEANSIDRATAIDALYLEVISFCRSAQYTKLLAITEHQSVINFLKDEDFSPLLHSVFIKELR
jgi:hypothetical protein